MSHQPVQSLFEQAVQHHGAGRLQEAEALYRQILARQPDHSEALHHLGVIAHQSERNDIAVELILQAIAIAPSAGAYSNLGIAYKRLGQLDAAIAAYRRSISLDPGCPQAYNNLGNALSDKRELDEAIAVFRRAIDLLPTYAEACNNLGNALRESGRVDEAMVAFEQALALRPDYMIARCNAAVALSEKGLYDDAITMYRRALELQPDYAVGWNNLGSALKDTGQVDQAIAAFRKAIALMPDYAEAHSNLIFTLHFHPASTAQTIAEELARWNRQHAQPLSKFVQPHRNDRSADRRLRIGYVSPDFREHVVGQNLLPLFDLRDRGRFEVIGYSQVSRSDPMTQRFRHSADGWRDIVGMSDEQVAHQIREDRIDILVDLAVHTAANRLRVFARRPAPVQLTYLGYCGSTGLNAMDYRLSDPYLDPLESDLSGNVEKTVRLPRSYWCYQPGLQIEVSPSPAATNGFVTFGCLCNFAKVSASALQAWIRILNQVPNSRMIIHARVCANAESVASQFQRAGVSADRLRMAGTQPRPAYMQTYSHIDIVLDTFPYAGGITTCDALWMGVPVISLSGNIPVGRGGRSILFNIGETGLLANTPDEYVQIAVSLARDPARLNRLRRELRPRMQASPLMDARGFTRDVETAYRQMWRTWCESV